MPRLSRRSRSHRGRSRSACYIVKVFAIKDNRDGLPSGKEPIGDERIELRSGILVIDTIDIIVTSYLTRQDICELLRLIYDKDTERYRKSCVEFTLHAELVVR